MRQAQPVTSSPEQNKGLVRRHFEEANNQRHPELWDELMEDGFVIHHPLVEPGRDGYRGGCAAWWAAFPDARVEIFDLFGKGDRVAARWVERGTHTGEFSGMAPTGRTFELRGISLFRVRDGRLAEVSKRRGRLPAATGRRSQWPWT